MERKEKKHLHEVAMVTVCRLPGRCCVAPARTSSRQPACLYVCVCVCVSERESERKMQIQTV